MFGLKKKDKTKKRNSTISIEKSISATSSKKLKTEGIKGAQWFAHSNQINECELCKVLDGKTINIDHPDFDRFIPPLHEGCKCMRVYIGKNNTGEIYDWESPNDDLVKKYFHR